MKINNITRYLVIGVLVVLAAASFFAHAIAQDSPNEDVISSIPILEGSPLAKKQYLIQLSGTVMNETFSGAQALLTISGPSPLSQYNNPYLIIIEGFPKRNSVNSFFWNSGFSEMNAIANEVTCDIKRTFIKEVPIYFLSLSPELLRHSGALEMRAGDEGKTLAERVALPTFINSRAGQLKLRIHSNSISGSVWMKGYDPVEKSFVLYNARLHGRKTYHLQPKQDQKKLTTVRE